MAAPRKPESDCASAQRRRGSRKASKGGKGNTPWWQGAGRRLPIDGWILRGLNPSHGRLDSAPYQLQPTLPTPSPHPLTASGPPRLCFQLVRGSESEGRCRSKPRKPLSSCNKRAGVGRSRGRA